MFGRRARSAAGRGVALAAAGIVAASLVLVGGPPERADAGGGDWLAPARDRYEAGQQVTMIGYGGGVDATLLSRGPFYAWLRVDPAAVDADLSTSSLPEPGVHRSDLRVGEVTVDHVGVDGGGLGREHRASVTFDLPEDLPAGRYQVRFCNDPCTLGLANFSGELVHVGVDPDHPLVRDWPLTDPAIRWLEDDALLALPYGGSVTAAEVRAGSVPVPVPAPAPAPEAAVPGSPPHAIAPGPPTPQPAAMADLHAAEAPAARRDLADRTADPAGGGDGAPGRANAWWIGAEVALLATAGVAGMAWSARRRRPIRL